MAKMHARLEFKLKWWWRLLLLVWAVQVAIGFKPFVPRCLLTCRVVV